MNPASPRGLEIACDRALLTAAQAGDERALRCLVERHRNGLELFCYLMAGERCAASRRFQDATLDAWRQRTLATPNLAPQLWLYRVFARECIDPGISIEPGISNRTGALRARKTTQPTGDDPMSSMNIQRALVLGAHSGVGLATANALTAAGVAVVGAGRERDATDPAQVEALLAEADPELVVVAAGARPRMVSIEEQSWDSFSEPWNVDVKIAFEVGRAALARPLRPGSTVVIVSSGAGVNGSPLSGGYAGAKRMQMFLTMYLQRAADARDLEMRFVGLAPMQFLVGTRIGEAATTAYGPGDWPAPLDPDGVARAILSIASDDQHCGLTLGVTADGLREI